MDPYASSVYFSSYAAVEQFNPARYYNETGMTPGSLPTGTTGPSRVATAPSPLNMYVVFGILAVVIWALESHKMGRFKRLVNKV